MTERRATDEALDLLHAATIAAITEEIAGYKARREPVPPALLGQAIKVLKDNGIDSPARAQKVKDHLEGTLPSFEDIEQAHQATH